jgi:hypothetical protein
MYHITEYTYRQAKRIGVTVKPSTVKDKKIDVFRNGEKIASVGGAGYLDYPSYIKKEGLEHANFRRKLYKIRHEKDRHKKWSRGWLSDQLLW